MDSDLVAAAQRSESHPHTLHYQTLKPQTFLAAQYKKL